MPERSDRKREIRADATLPRFPETGRQAASLEIVVPFTNIRLIPKVVEHALGMAPGLNATIRLVAVYVAAYPAELRCPAAAEEFLATRLAEVAEQAGVTACVQVVVARDQDTGFRHALRPQSVVVIGSPKRPWRTCEEMLARRLARQGHHVSLLHFD